MLITINIGPMATAAPPATGADVQRALVADLREQLATAARGGSERSRTRHVERGKLLPRERVDRLVDPLQPLPRALPARRPRPLRRRPIAVPRTWMFHRGHDLSSICVGRRAADPEKRPHIRLTRVHRTAGDGRLPIDGLK